MPVQVMLEFVGWLREHNDKLAREHKGEGPETAARRKVGVYGFDLYSLFSSIQEVLRCVQRRA
jgi:erythromycin esterase-like protein